MRILAGFNPRPSCEGRPASSEWYPDELKFQSTPLLRGATRTSLPNRRRNMCFNPRPSCEGRPLLTSTPHKIMQFQSTPLLRGATCKTHQLHSYRWFQSTPLLRGATGVAIGPNTNVEVSIHAPLARGDPLPLTRPNHDRSFNPRPSCEGRHVQAYAILETTQFQSTPLLRGATCMILWGG